MKQFVLLFFTFFLLLSCENENGATEATATKTDAKTKTFEVVTSEEYANATAEEKKLYDSINATASALLQLDESYSAIVSINRKNLSDPYTGIIITQEQQDNSSNTRKAGGSCTVCGVSSAYKCLTKLQKIRSDEFDIHVRRNGSCVILTWET